nr:tetratricopeptide repeat protein [Bacteroidota bacterium]
MMSFEAHKRLDDEENMAYTLNNLSACYVRLGNYEKGLDMALKSLKIKEKKGNENDIAMSLINIGGILVKLGNDDDALEKYLSALGIFNKGKSHKYVGKCLSNIGSIYKRKGKLDIARQYYADAKERYVEANETMYLASVYRYIAGIDLKEGMVSNAMENYRNSLSICNDFQDHYGITTSKMGIGESLKILGDIAGAIRYFQEALTHAVEIGATDLQRDAHLSLSECYEKTGRNSSALDEYKLYAQLTDSLLNQDKVKNMNELQIRYETEKKEQEIRILKQQNEIDNLEIIRQNQQLRQQRNIIFVSVVMILLVGIILLLLFNRYRLKQVATKEKAKRKALQIESRLLRTQMNPHFLFNSLNSIQNYISDADTFMAETYLSKFAQLVRNILEHSRKNLITLEDDIRSLRLYLELEQLRFKGLFDFDISTSKQLDDDEYFIPPMLIQPFAENAIIHGIRHKPEKGHLAIRLNLADDLIICEVEDDGIGRRNSMEINKNRHKSPSMGMQVTQERIEVLRHQMNAGAEFRIIDLEDQDGKPAGTKVIVHIPFEQDI